ncbi:NADH-quinone oxidoreductase subunit J [Legionella impletisoli]|uniref:NADH-quinone oxidoreductase subunit J n=1 Tax=Legionella impletisoli TaxID=343510 RepID=A0A917JTP9_9GAMM|nr:NADH-quinone oxidoreductase subunit J [Legionella impletisoli]GGI84206.1 NADH:ubiquinone oxidoreductase subunit J [Legionella impletisoli]
MQDLLPHVIFYVFAAIAVLSAFMVVTQNNPVRCVLFLVLTFFASSVLWIMVHAEFLALILVLVYVGAVMTLFLFVIMMLNIDVESMRTHILRYLPFGLIIVALLTGLLLVAIPSDSFKSSVQLSQRAVEIVDESFVPLGVTPKQPISNTESLGLVLYTDYVLAFELAAAILLVSIIAAITLAHRRPHRSKQQDIVRQIMTRREDRVRLVSMKPEK